MQNRKGFTLIELLVVVLIIGILASVAIPQYFKVVEKGRASEAISMLSSICAAQERELLRNGSFETSTLNLDINVPVMKFFNPPVLTAGAAGTGANA
ncbi:MAG: prepilin-type N-terminal cleavage/methylation domain-containing protein, partial [Elusimicrobia bacterium]|nr:prepilin-type N-terminal cleavage/methylation domain-containing protein [Elusimicrobiota bacterium]